MTKYLGFKKNKQVDKNTFVMRQIHPNTTDKIGCKTSRKMTFITLYSLKKDTWRAPPYSFYVFVWF